MAIEDEGVRRNVRQRAYRARLKANGVKRLEVTISPKVWKKLLPYLEPRNLSHPGFAVARLMEEIAYGQS